MEVSVDSHAEAGGSMRKQQEEAKGVEADEGG